MSIPAPQIVQTPEALVDTDLLPPLIDRADHLALRQLGFEVKKSKEWPGYLRAELPPGWDRRLAYDVEENAGFVAIIDPNRNIRITCHANDNGVWAEVLTRYTFGNTSEDMYLPATEGDYYVTDRMTGQRWDSLTLAICRARMQKHRGWDNPLLHWGDFQPQPRWKYLLYKIYRVINRICQPD